MIYNNRQKKIRPVANETNELSSTYITLLEEYMEQNPQIGYLTFQVTEDSAIRGIVPIPNAKITVSKLLGDSFYFSKILTTTIDGKTDSLELPTVSAELSKVPGRGRPYATYNASIEAPNYITQNVFDIPIFEGITAIQSVTMKPILTQGIIPPTQIMG